MRKRFYIAPKSINVHQVNLILQNWLDNHRYKMLDLTRLTEELNICLRKEISWGCLTIEMQMMDENGFVIEVNFLDTSSKEYNNILTTIEW